MTTREMTDSPVTDLRVGDRILWFDTMNPDNYSFEILELNPEEFSAPPTYKLVRGSIVAKVRWKNGDLDTRVWPPCEHWRMVGVDRLVVEAA